MNMSIELEKMDKEYYRLKNKDLHFLKTSIIINAPYMLANQCLMQ